MSGHSKWHNIRLKKGKVDAKRGALFTKLSKEIILAARSGSADPEANYRLKMAVDKARENNMPQENIKRAIARGSGQDGEREIEELHYEGHGPHGMAVIVEAATDNRNRTAGELRFLFTKNGGTLGEPGAVGWMFDAVGIVECGAQGKPEDAFTEDALVDGVVDVEYAEEGCFIYTEPTALSAARDALRARDFKISAVYLGSRAKQKIHPEGKDAEDAFGFLDALDDHEDIQHVFTNVELSDATLEAMA